MKKKKDSARKKDVQTNRTSQCVHAFLKDANCEACSMTKDTRASCNNRPLKRADGTPPPFTLGELNTAVYEHGAPAHWRERIEHHREGTLCTHHRSDGSYSWFWLYSRVSPLLQVTSPKMLATTHSRTVIPELDTVSHQRYVKIHLAGRATPSRHKFEGHPGIQRCFTVHRKRMSFQPGVSSTFGKRHKMHARDSLMRVHGSSNQEEK